MALSVIPATESFAYEDATPSPLDRVQRRTRASHLGRGLLRPFRRGDKTDFANAEGEELVKASIGQILGMQGSSQNTVGELAWAPERGAQLYRLRHQSNDLVLQQLGRVYVADALARFEPRVVLLDASVTRQKSPDGQNGENVLVIRLVYDVIRSNVSGNQVYLSGIEQTVELRT